MTDQRVEHVENPHGSFCAECEEPWPCEVTRLRALITAYLENDSQQNWDALANAVLDDDDHA